MKRRRAKPGFDELSDIELMQCAVEGNIPAYGVLVRRHQESLLNFFRKLGVYSEGEDLVQNTFLRIYRSRENYRPKAKFTTFLYRVARTVWIDWVRKSARRDDALREYESELLVWSDTRRRCRHAGMDMQEAVEALPEKLRIVVVMSIYQGLKYREIAEVLDIPVGTVKSRMSLAMDHLRSHLGVAPKGFEE